jgi:chorismate mutase/prephenate dehydratase
VSEELLKQHRDAIDSIDAQILHLLNSRASHAREIGEIKGGGIIYRPEREAQVLRRIQQLNPGPLPNESVARLFREVMSECLALEKPLSIAYLGPEGTFTQLAAIKHFGHAARTVACASVDEAFRLVESRTLDYVVAPVENSTEGAVGRTLDLMVSSPLRICGEVVLRIHHHLLRKEEGMAGITRVYAHAQALAQCHEWLNKNLPENVERMSVASNAEAARLAGEDARPQPLPVRPLPNAMGWSNWRRISKTNLITPRAFWCWAISKLAQPVRTRPPSWWLRPIVRVRSISCWLRWQIMAFR